MIGCIFTSLKVVSMAVSFLTATNRRETVLRSDDILVRRSLRLPGAAGVLADDSAAEAEAALPVAVEAADGADFWSCAFSASSLVMRPSFPVPFTVAGSIPFSRRILAAAGEAVPEA